ncbi:MULTISPECIES: HPP family protein [Streptomyces]|uniref:CBS domain-containing protein n=1 Tax=Streptomyces rochei TaxID=1928 RepID=A0AAX3ZBH9_STRRO|nr:MULTISPECIES: CBS domain-containing protein [Streptomyces]MBQ0881521.1 CBS domain-containing protein [Streptomyces sp. RT42]WMC84160.1 CBS domain-containing protein [Streptomyces rochei]
MSDRAQRTLQHRHEHMVRYLQAMASHSAEAARGEPLPTEWQQGEDARRDAARPRVLADLRVSDIMRCPDAVPTVTAGTPLLDVARTMARRHAEAMPVTDDDRRVIGVVAESDLLARAATLAGPKGDTGLARLSPKAKVPVDKATVASLMSAPAVTVRPWTTVIEAARTAARARVRQIFVTDHHDRLVGVVTRNELLHALVRDDSAIHDEIVDRVLRELDIPSSRVRVRVRNGVVTLTGALNAARIAALTEAVKRIADVSEVDDLLTEI